MWAKAGQAPGIRRLIVITLAGTIGATAVAVADPGLPNIGEHRHFLQMKDGGFVEVGPRLCDNAALQRAFNQYHSNVHFAVPGSPGPEQAAPGLHNGHGPDIVSRGCAFTAP
jgi:hypothetical protein